MQAALKKQTSSTPAIYLTRRTPKDTIRELVVQRLRHRGKLPRSPRILYPDPARRAYEKAILATLSYLKGLIQSEVVPHLKMLAIHAQTEPGKVEFHADAAKSPIATMLHGVKVTFGRRYSDEEVGAIARKTGASVSAWNKKEMKKTTSRLLGLEVVTDEPWLNETMAEFSTENVALIKSVGADYLKDLQGVLEDAFTIGTRVEELGDLILGRYGVAQSHARLIARDQIGKLQSNLTQARQKDLGIEKYRWRGALDERERDEHLEREGKTYSYDDPPEDGNPGEPVCCRCYAEPILPGEDDDEAEAA